MTTIHQPWTSLFLFTLLGGILLGSSAASEPTQITSAVQLFVDDYVVDTTDGVRRQVNRWKKYPGNPVLRPSKPWEMGGTYLNVYGSVIYDEDEKLFKCWYWTMNAEDSPIPTQNIKVMCYATSTDGIHWEKPNVGIFEFPGSKDNNIVMASKFDDKKQRAYPVYLWSHQNAVGPRSSAALQSLFLRAAPRGKVHRS